MSKKNLNNHKGPIENNLHRNPRFCPFKKKNNKKKKIPVVALDSNILIDMESVFLRRPDKYLTPEYRKCLINLYTMFKAGRICFCITPTVKEEVTDNNPNLHEFLYDVLSESIMLDINPTKKKDFNKKISAIASDYVQNGVFVDQENDAKISAESAYFNLTLITHDKHFKPIRIMHVNNKHLATETSNPDYAHSINPQDFMKMYKNNREWEIPDPENLNDLSAKVQDKFSKIGYNPKKVVEVKLVPTKRAKKEMIESGITL